MEQLASIMQGAIALLARLLLAAIFVVSAVANKIPQFQATAAYMASEGVPNPKFALFGAIGLLLIGGLSVVLGAWTRIGAAFLLVFLLAATYYFHDFWKLPPDTPPATMQGELIAFMKNLALMGTMLFLVANGTGPWSLDNRGKATAQDAAADDDDE